jgi:hypothetical protein
VQLGVATLMLTLEDGKGIDARGGQSAHCLNSFEFAQPIER